MMFQTKYCPAKIQKMEKDFPWLEYNENYQSEFCKVCRMSESQSLTSQGSNGVWGTKPFQNWERRSKRWKHMAAVKPTSDTLAELLAKERRRINHSSFTTCWGSREVQELKCYQVISSPYSFPMQTFLTRQTLIC